MRRSDVVLVCVTALLAAGGRRARSRVHLPDEARQLLLVPRRRRINRTGPESGGTAAVTRTITLLGGGELRVALAVRRSSRHTAHSAGDGVLGRVLATTLTQPHDRHYREPAQTARREGTDQGHQRELAVLPVFVVFGGKGDRISAFILAASLLASQSRTGLNHVLSITNLATAERLAWLRGHARLPAAVVAVAPSRVPGRGAPVNGSTALVPVSDLPASFVGREGRARRRGANDLHASAVVSVSLPRALASRTAVARERPASVVVVTHLVDLPVGTGAGTSPPANLVVPVVAVVPGLAVVGVLVGGWRCRDRRCWCGHGWDRGGHGRDRGGRGCSRHFAGLRPCVGTVVHLA
eukprot:Hpha_TRINITY_DN15790_c3_g1::TRINITY_DN15790_c3_g1_i1::g.38478::m.38478